MVSRGKRSAVNVSRWLVASALPLVLASLVLAADRAPRLVERDSHTGALRITVKDAGATAVPRRGCAEQTVGTGVALSAVAGAGEMVAAIRLVPQLIMPVSAASEAAADGDSQTVETAQLTEPTQPDTQNHEDASAEPTIPDRAADPASARQNGPFRLLPGFRLPEPADRQPFSPFVPPESQPLPGHGRPPLQEPFPAGSPSATGPSPLDALGPMMAAARDLAAAGDQAHAAQMRAAIRHYALAWQAERRAALAEIERDLAGLERCLTDLEGLSPSDESPQPAVQLHARLLRIDGRAVRAAGLDPRVLLATLGIVQSRQSTEDLVGATLPLLLPHAGPRATEEIVATFEQLRQFVSVTPLATVNTLAGRPTVWRTDAEVQTASARSDALPLVEIQSPGLNVRSTAHWRPSGRLLVETLVEVASSGPLNSTASETQSLSAAMELAPGEVCPLLIPTQPGEPLVVLVVSAELREGELQSVRQRPGFPRELPQDQAPQLRTEPSTPPRSLGPQTLPPVWSRPFPPTTESPLPSDDDMPSTMSAPASPFRILQPYRAVAARSR